MKQLIGIILYLVATGHFAFAQPPEASFSRSKMRKDLEIFKSIREEANSGLHKYRTKEETDSIYTWAFEEIESSATYLDFFNIICKLTDFEGSLHNYTRMSAKTNAFLKEEDQGYFPFPLKLTEDKMILNYKNDTIPLGAEIVAINGWPMLEILPNLFKYTTTDGKNITGKFWDVNYAFSKFFRLHYGQHDTFEVRFKVQGANAEQAVVLKGIANKAYYKRNEKRYSKPFDEPLYKDFEAEEMYAYEEVQDGTGKLTLHSFAIGDNGDDPEHLKFKAFLDSVFNRIKKKGVKNLIVDVRNNGGGSDPNDLTTYSYLAQRNFTENKKAWISFRKIPMLRYIDNPLPAFLRPFFVGKYTRYFKKDFPVEKNGRFYQNENSADHKVWQPNKNAFTGSIYLLVGPAVASAGSLFAAMVAGNENTVVIGEETMGGYYGHNGHVPLTYILPKSKIETGFSIVNLEQDVPEKGNQHQDRGIIPDIMVKQTYADYLNQVDTQMNFTIDLIRKKMQDL